MFEKALAVMLLILLAGAVLHAVITRIVVPLCKPPKN